MPCSICGKNGHNRRTCPILKVEDEPVPPRDPPPPKIDDTVLIMLSIEKDIRNIIIQDKLSELSEDRITFYESFLNIQKKEFKIINLDKYRSMEIYLINNNSKLIDMNIDSIDINDIDCTYLGQINPRGIIQMTSFTGYTYLVMDEYKMFDTIDVSEEMNDTQLINYIVDISIPSKYPSTKKINNENHSLFASLKLNYLIQQMIRLGALNEDKYPDLYPILELHDSIQMPQYDSLDLEAAGLPNELTNIT